MVSVEEVRKAQRAEGPATVMAIGTATPPNSVDQTTYPDFYFRVTNSDHKVELKDKFKRICEKSGIKKRYVYLTEEIMRENPRVCECMAPSLDARQDMAIVEVPRLGKEAAMRAIEEWAQPKSKISHLIFCTTSGADMPGADYQLTRLLDLRPSVKRLMLYNLVGAAVLPAVIVRSDPIQGYEKPLFELVSATQTILPDSNEAISGHLREVGLTFHLLKHVPNLISKNIGTCLREAFSLLGLSDWNSLFWIAHPGGPAILDQVELELGLRPEKLWASRRVLSEYGNMSSASVLFVLDEMRNRSTRDGLGTSGDGLEWGVLFGFGPGVTLETVVLHSVAVN